MGIPIKRLLKEIDSRDITDYIAYYQIEPFGTEQDFLQAGIVASTVANVNRGKNTQPFKPQDFVPSSFKAKIVKKQSAEDMKFIFGQMAVKKPKKEKPNG